MPKMPCGFAWLTQEALVAGRRLEKPEIAAHRDVVITNDAGVVVERLSGA